MNTQKIAIFGFGTVGGGVGKILWENKEESQKIRNLKITWIRQWRQISQEHD